MARTRGDPRGRSPDLKFAQKESLPRSRRRALTAGFFVRVRCGVAGRRFQVACGSRALSIRRVPQIGEFRLQLPESPHTPGGRPMADALGHHRYLVMAVVRAEGGTRINDSSRADAGTNRPSVGSSRRAAW